MIEELRPDFKPLANVEERPLKMYLDAGDHGVVIGEERIHLTPSEYQVLWLLNSRAGDYVSEDQIRQFIYDDEDVDAPLSETIDVFITRLRNKLNREGNPNISIGRRYAELGWKLERT